MTKEDIITMARECGIPSSELYHANLERFAALAIAAERNSTWTPEHWTEYERGIAAAEREACIADVQLCIPRSGHSTPEIVFAKKAIDRIRARGQS